nr:hypothetical protein Itr_chr10CG03890 [Ipomoea trifida]
MREYRTQKCLGYKNVAAIPIAALIPRAIPIIYAEGLISTLLFGKDLNALFWLLSLKAGTPLDTELRSQYSMQTDTIFHRARAMADAVREMKLMMHPEITGANNLHTKSIRLIIEFMFVCSSGGWPSDITTTLQMRTQNHHSLSINMVPARLESTAAAPETLISIMSNINGAELIGIKSGQARTATTEAPATIKERFLVSNQNLRTCE